MAPFVAADGPPNRKKRHYADILPENNTGMPIIPQVIGKEPEGILATCRTLAALGYQEVNWNLGCPWRMVTRKMRGAGLLPHPDRIRAVLACVTAADGCRFSVKVRLGLDRADQLFAVIPVLNDYPLSEVIVHPRTALQMYDGVADADAFDACRKRLKHRAVYNGDIRTVEDYRRLSARFPDVHDWMLGRGLVADPFLAAGIKTDPLPPALETVRRFHDELYEQYKEGLFGARPVLGKMKELWFYLSGSFRDGERILKKIQRSVTLEAYEGIVGRFFGGDPDWTGSDIQRSS